MNRPDDVQDIDEVVRNPFKWLDEILEKIICVTNDSTLDKGKAKTIPKRS